MELGKVDVKKYFDDFIDSLNLGPNRPLGIDIGYSSIKICELEHLKGERFKLVRYNKVPLPEGCIIEDEIQQEEALEQALIEAFTGLKSSLKKSSLALFGPNTIARKLQLAGGNLEEIEDQVLWEAEQYLPFDVDESALSFHILGENEGGGAEVLVAGAKKTVLDRYKDIVERAGTRVKTVELCSTALINILNYITDEHEVSEGRSILLIDFGAQKTEFIVVKNGTPIFIKEVSVGGLMISEEIQRQMGVNYAEAEQLKILTDENGNLPEEILEILNTTSDNFLAEIKKTFDFYLNTTSDDALEHVYLTGGSSQVPSLAEKLGETLEKQVSILNPFERILVDEKTFSEDDIHHIAYEGTVALGLAMRKIRK